MKTPKSTMVSVGSHVPYKDIGKVLGAIDLQSVVIISVAVCGLLVVFTALAARRLQAATNEFVKQENRSREIAGQLRELTDAAMRAKSEMHDLATESERLESLPARLNVSSKASRGVRIELDALRDEIPVIKANIRETLEQAKRTR